MIQNLNGFDYWIMDEVSMMGQRMFDCLYEGMKLVMGRGCRIIMVGDFLQLPQVPQRDFDPETKEWYTAYLSDRYAFESPQWSVVNPETGMYQHTGVVGLNLQSQHRQADNRFIKALNLARRGALTDDLVQILKEHSVQQLPEDCTILAPTRKMVQDINDRRLAQIDSEQFTFDADVEPLSAFSPAANVAPDMNLVMKVANKQARFPMKLTLKVGARVMMVKNNWTAGYVNGTTGEVADIDIKEGIITVKTDDGRLIDVEPDVEVINNHESKPIINIHQYPMILAFAVTIHKAQGCTIDRAGVIVNDHFAAGQTYVALTRVRDPSGLFIQGNVYGIKTEPKVLNYMNSFGWLNV
jgi:ATP-dependent exoDNAse (exonuclease V) alpha subunit